MASRDYFIRPTGTATGLRHGIAWVGGGKPTEQTFPTPHAARMFMRAFGGSQEVPAPSAQYRPMQQAPLPYAAGSETSKDAAESMVEVAGIQREKVYAYLLSEPGGKTRQEIYRHFKSTMQSVGPRVVELMNAGLVYEDGKRPTESGRDAYILHARPRDADTPAPPRRLTKSEQLTAMGNTLAHLCEQYIGLQESTDAVAAWRKAVGK